MATLTGPRTCDHHQHGCGTWRYHFHFPFYDVTRGFLKAQNREEDWVELKADDDAVYDEVYEINLSELKPLAACPHSPDNIKSIDEIGAKKGGSSLHRLLHQLILFGFNAW